tara:strand:+ start:1121 stop:1351 length:231 start_codon:yes stop_codon:yes gene_type:complete
MLGKKRYERINPKPVNCQMIGLLCPQVYSLIQAMYWITFFAAMMRNLTVEAHEVHTQPPLAWLMQLSPMNYVKTSP